MEAGCSKAGSQAEDVWVRVVGLPLHCWSEKIFKRIGDCCGGFVEVDGETKNCSQLQWARILVKNRGNFFSGTMHLAVDDYCYALQLWWERLPWLSKVVPMKKMKGGEKEKAREEQEVGSRAKSSSSKGKEIWHAVEAVGADSVKKVGGEEKLDGDGTPGTTKAFSALGKKFGGKRRGVVGLSEGVNRLDQCKPTLEVSQVHLDWALKEKEKLSGPWDCWEEGWSNEGSRRAYSDGHSSPPWVGPGGVDCRPSLGLIEGQSKEALWACPSFRATKERRLKETRASFGRSCSEKWLEEELLPSGMFSAAKRSENGRASFADEWLMEENARYSTLEPSAVCFWGDGSLLLLLTLRGRGL